MSILTRIVNQALIMRQIFILSLVFFAVGGAAFANNPMQNKGLCHRATSQVEKEYNIPQNLLRAISLTESGRWNKEQRANVAWPWTVASGGAGEFFPTKQEAIAYVQKLQSQGVTNIDVGCMQINLFYHPEAFRDLHEAFEPYNNVRYGGAYLSKMFAMEKSWHRAAASYHSTKVEKGMKYREKVMAYWNYANSEDRIDNEEDNLSVQQVAVEDPEIQPEVQAQPKAEPEYQQVARLVDENRMSRLNSAFRKRLTTQRDAFQKAEKISQQLANWRQTRFGQNPAVNAARQQALYNQKQKRLLMGTTTDVRTDRDADSFAKRRQAQLNKWRRTQASPALFDPKNVQETGFQGN